MGIVAIGLAFAIGWFMSAGVLPKISLISYRRRLFDLPSERKVHTSPIPRLGGVAFFPCIIVAVCIVVVCHNLLMERNLLDLELTTQLLALICSTFVLYLIGLMDDLVGLRYRVKFLFQMLCAILIVASGLYFDNLHGLFGIYNLPVYVAVPFSVLGIVYIINALNLIDGIDGLASGLSIIAFIAFGFMFVMLQWWLYALLAAAALGTLVPFFYFNVFGKVRRGRKIFMGDTGSLTIGLLLAVLAIKLGQDNAVKDAAIPGAIVIAFSFLMVPLLDVIRVMVHRIRRGRNPFVADKSHIHHKFMALGMKQRAAMVHIVAIALAFAIANVLLVHVLNTTVLFLADIALWTVMHWYISWRISKSGPQEGAYQ